MSASDFKRKLDYLDNTSVKIALTAYETKLRLSSCFAHDTPTDNMFIKYLNKTFPYSTKTKVRGRSLQDWLAIKKDNTVPYVIAATAGTAATLGLVGTAVYKSKFKKKDETLKNQDLPVRIEQYSTFETKRKENDLRERYNNLEQKYKTIKQRYYLLNLNFDHKQIESKKDSEMYKGFLANSEATIKNFEKSQRRQNEFANSQADLIIKQTALNDNLQQELAAVKDELKEQLKHADVKDELKEQLAKTMDELTSTKLELLNAKKTISESQKVSNEINKTNKIISEVKNATSNDIFKKPEVNATLQKINKPETNKRNTPKMKGLRPYYR
jgi:hypothetical protein